MEKNGVSFDNEEDKLLADLEQLEIQFGLLEIQLSTVKSKDRDEIERLGSQETEYFEKIYQIKRKLLMMRQVARLKGELVDLTFFLFFFKKVIIFSRMLNEVNASC